MKPPSPEVIDDALALLIDSVILENGTNHYLDPTGSGHEADRLDSIVEAFHLAACTLQARVDNLVAQYKTHRNHVVPLISQLPNEILGRIFCLAVPAKSWSTKKLQQLALVCKSWSNAVKSTPELWAVVQHNMLVSTPTLEHVEMALRLSKRAPLTLLFRKEPQGATISSRAIAEDQLVVSDKLAIAGEHTDRWRSFTFHGRFTPSVLDALEHPELSLETLEIMWPPEYDLPLQSFILANGDRLRHLALSNVAIQCGLFEGLVSLRLNNATSPPSTPWLPSLTQLVDILEASPDLEVLTLQQHLDRSLEESPSRVMSYLDTGSPLPSPGRVIYLPRLQCLVLRNLSHTMTHHLLQYIDSDALTRVRIRVSCPESGMPFSSDDDPRLAVSALDKMSERHKLGIWHGGNSVYAWATSGGEKTIMDMELDDVEHSKIPYFEVRFTGRAGDAEGPMQDVADMCGLSDIVERPVTLYFSPQAASMSLADILGTVRTMPYALKLLNLWNLRWDACVAVLQLLLQPETNPDGGHQWPYPQLKQIHLPSSLDTSSVVEVIKQRWAIPMEWGVFFGENDEDRPDSIVIVVNKLQKARELKDYLSREVAGKSSIEPNSRSNATSWNIRYELPGREDRPKSHTL
ncbi:hypothetical protein FRB96_005883 [Tulasnella sp. 330]|nr:hypothetical protein FRB96_005883 [Tulasnella sp. 330]KAG8884566.1 hypothetical protein FRB97_003862 [Tulasnella sp. 331]KAG8889548.1 hypothetical protein FRB98_003816 [Tulasnella sp. 332]